MSISESSTAVLKNMRAHSPSIGDVDVLKSPISDHAAVSAALKNSSPPHKKTYNKSKVKQSPVQLTEEDDLPSTRITAVREAPYMDATLSNDVVLLNIISTLYENESGNELDSGLTVKQISDKLLLKDPSMSSLSTKFANLISAKLNAYAKKVENRVRGDRKLNIKYWVIRKWAKGSSPRRMVYIYKGLLPEDYFEIPPLSAEQSVIPKETNKNNENVSHKSTKNDKKQSLAGKNINYNTVLNGSGLSRLNNINGVINNLTKGKPTASKRKNKFAVNFNRFQQFGYKEMNSKSNGKPSAKRSSPEIDNGCSTPNKSLDLDEECITNHILSPKINNTQMVNNLNKEMSVNKVDLAQQLKLIQQSIYQASPVQRIQKLKRRRRSSANLMLNKRWLETLKSGFMYEEISTPDNLKLSDFDTLFD